MIDTSKVIYSINIEDVQNVADQELDRELTEKELRIVEDKLGDYVDWYGAIDMTIRNEILILRKKRRGKSDSAT